MYAVGYWPFAYVRRYKAPPKAHHHEKLIQNAAMAVRDRLLSHPERVQAVLES